MRSSILALVYLSFCAISGCEHATFSWNGRGASAEEQRAASSREGAGEKLLEQKRNGVLADLEAKLAELDRSIGTLRMRYKNSPRAQVEAHDEVAQLEVKRKLLVKSLTELQLSGASAWEAMMRDATTAWDQLRQAYDAAAVKIK